MPTTAPPKTENQIEHLQEYTDSRGVALRVDSTAGVLTGVKLIGLSSRNGRQYRETALELAVPLYEEARVNVNHPKEGPLAPRDYQDRLGTIRGVEFRAGEGLFGNLHFNPRHALAEQLVWDAEHNPRNVGFSHNVQARVTRTDAGLVVEQITRVQSVDLVADPATTDGLFEQAATDTDETPGKFQWDVLTLESLRLHRPDLLAEIKAARVTDSRSLKEQLLPRIVELERRLEVATGPRSRDQLAVVESIRAQNVDPQGFARSLKHRN